MEEDPKLNFMDEKGMPMLNPGLVSHVSVVNIRMGVWDGRGVQTEFSDNLYFDLPAGIPQEAVPMVEAWELVEGDGSVVVVSDSKGKPLHNHLHNPDGEKQARFIAPEVIQHHLAKDGTLTIVCYVALRDSKPTRGRIYKERLWFGEVTNLGTDPEHMRVVEMAIAKLRCEKCSEPHYAQT